MANLVGRRLEYRYRTVYTKNCECCGETFITSRKDSRFKRGHRLKKYDYKSGYDFKGRTPGPTPPIIFPSLEEAYRRKPAVCGKCGAKNIHEERIEYMFTLKNGQGLYWSCRMCGWTYFPFPGETR